MQYILNTLPVVYLLQLDLSSIQKMETSNFKQANFTEESGENNKESHTGIKSGNSEITIDIRPLLEDVSHLMTKHISRMLEGVVGDYTTYKQTHDAIMGLPCIAALHNKIHSLETLLKHQNGNAASNSDDHDDDHDQANDPKHHDAPNDYTEVVQLKKSIDQLTKHIHFLESQVAKGSFTCKNQQDNAVNTSCATSDDDYDGELP